jgi:2-amino-4-hydroxy-6-hydroxymethyldihydropteridine diphosphokinase
MVAVFIGLGSNLGDRKSNIFRALDLLRQNRDIQVREVSTLLETQPVGPVHDQPLFLNAVAAIETSLVPHELLAQLLSIEQRLGRVRRERWGPRNIDLDILVYGNERIDLPNLKIPHPEIKNRPFVQAGLRELAAHE